MIIHNDFVLLLLRKLCVSETLQKGDPQFLPPPQHNRDNRYNIYLPIKVSVAIQTAPLLPPLLSMLYILANVHWVLIKKVREYSLLCLMLRTYHTPRHKSAPLGGYTLAYSRDVSLNFFQKFRRNLCRQAVSPPSA